MIDGGEHGAESEVQDLMVRGLQPRERTAPDLVLAEDGHEHARMAQIR